MPAMAIPAFVRKRIASVRNEKAASHEHFIDLCNLLGHETPNDDPTGDRFAFEKGGGGDGFADVWKRGFFAWEHKDLAYGWPHALTNDDILERLLALNLSRPSA